MADSQGRTQRPVAQRRYDGNNDCDQGSLLIHLFTPVENTTENRNQCRTSRCTNIFHDRHDRRSEIANDQARDCDKDHKDALQGKRLFVIHLFEAADHIAGQHDGANHRNRCCGPHNSCQQCCQQDGTQECTRVIIDHSGQDGVRSAQFRDQRSANQTNQAGKQQIRYIDQQSCGKGGVPRLTAALGTALTVTREMLEEADTLKDLNFLDVKFEMVFGQTADYTANGTDDPEFLISTNPGEPVKPLGKVASGGELSRIMLAIKTVLADQDAIETLIFDEIDSGISGRTAQMVSEKMNVLARNHQIICITHLPQIAAMADAHYLIEKSVENKTTVSKIKCLSGEESIDELARMLGGVEITDKVRESAREMKELAHQKKCQ